MKRYWPVSPPLASQLISVVNVLKSAGLPPLLLIRAKFSGKPLPIKNNLSAGQHCNMTILLYACFDRWESLLSMVEYSKITHADIQERTVYMEKTIEIFCCYARRDQSLLLELKTHLALLVRQGRISLQADIDISPGTPWEAEINKHLENAQFILLLVSPAFMASEYCYSKEMLRAMARHERGEARVIPIILRPVDLEEAPFSKLQLLPKNGKPVTSWPQRDKAFEDIAKSIRKAVQEYHQRSLSELLEEKSLGELLERRSLSKIIDEIPSLANIGRFEEALALCERLLPYGFADEYVYYYKGRVLLDMERYEESLDAFDHAISLVPGHVFAYADKARALEALHQYEDAVAVCDQGINSNPDYLPLYHIKADILMMHLSRWEEAIKTCDDCLHNDPRDSKAYSTKCMAMIFLKKYQEALDVCEQANLNDRVGYALKSFIMDELGNKQKALEYYQKLVDGDTSPTEGGTYMAEVLEKLGRYEEAIKVCDNTIRQNPDDAKIYNIKLFCLFPLGRYHEALEACYHLNRLLPHEGRVFEYQALAFAALGRYPEGLKACERAIDLGSAIIASSVRATCLEAMGHHSEALIACEQAIQQDPGAPSPYLTKGKAFYALKRYKESLEAFEQFLAIEPDDAETWYHKSKALEQLGKSDEAKTAYEEAVRLGYGEKSLRDVLEKY